MTEFAHDPNHLQAWDTEYGDYVVWGTHNPGFAKLEVRKYLREVIGEAPENIDECTPAVEDFRNARKMWADPAVLDMEEVWPKDMIAEHTDELTPFMGWVPYMVISS